MAIVEVRHLTKQFEGNATPAVDDLDLATTEGEYLVLLGPSGCGKTTLLRLIAGLEQPTSGEVYIGGLPMVGLPPRARKIAMVFQSYALYPRHTVYENIASPLRARRCSSSEIAAAVERISSQDGKSQLTVGGVSVVLVQVPAIRDRMVTTPDGRVNCVTSEFSQPNGLTLSPDESLLYINDSRDGIIRRYGVEPDGADDTRQSQRITQPVDQVDHCECEPAALRNCKQAPHDGHFQQAKVAEQRFQGHAQCVQRLHIGQ